MANGSHSQARVIPPHKAATWTRENYYASQIFVAPFPGPGGRVQVSSASGAQPRCRADGKELYYIDLDGNLVAVPIAFHDGRLVPGVPKVLFRTRIGQVSTQEEAVKAIQQRSGDAVLVVRGITRSLILNCPCGCGHYLTINLDSRVGPAWRIYLRNNALTLFPSYWRDSHCQSHFILWRNRIYWCDRDDWLSDEVSARLRQNVLETVPYEFTRYEIVAEKIGEIPWDVLEACAALTREGKAERHPDKRRRAEFRRRGA